MHSSVPGRAAASSPAPNLFSPRAAASGLPPARWSTENAGGKSAPSTPSAALRALPCRLRGFSQCAAAYSKSSRTGDEARGDGQLVRGQSQRFPCRRFVDSGHFEKDASRLYHRHPAFRGAFAFAHAGFRRLLGEGLVRKNADPQFCRSLEGGRYWLGGRLESAVGGSRRFERLQTVFPKRQTANGRGA